MIHPGSVPNHGDPNDPGSVAAAVVAADNGSGVVEVGPGIFPFTTHLPMRGVTLVSPSRRSVFRGFGIDQGVNEYGAIIRGEPAHGARLIGLTVDGGDTCEAGAGFGAWSEGVRIESCTFRNLVKRAIRFNGVTRAQIRRCRFHDISTWEIDPGTGEQDYGSTLTLGPSMDSLVIDGNYFTRCAMKARGTCIYPTYSTNVLITGNVFEGVKSGMRAVDSTGVVVTGNSARLEGEDMRYFVQAESVAGLVVDGNRASLTGLVSMAGVFLTADTHAAVVSNNWLDVNMGEAILVVGDRAAVGGPRGPKRVVIEGNALSSPGRAAIQLIDVDGTAIRGNTVSGARFGVNMYGVRDTSATSNKIACDGNAADYYGVNIVKGPNGHGSERVAVRDNDFTDTRHGVVARDCSRLLIRGSTWNRPPYIDASCTNVVQEGNELW